MFYLSNDIPMLRRNNSGDLSTCSLSSCRTKAETLARSLNNHVWPVTWGLTGDGDLSKDIREQEDEEFFDASPSPIEDEKCCRRDDSSAATVAGRAKLFELLQQHATDDASDVFYDVSENAEPSENVCENKVGNSKESFCLNGETLNSNLLENCAGETLVLEHDADVKLNSNLYDEIKSLCVTNDSNTSDIIKSGSKKLNFLERENHTSIYNQNCTQRSEKFNHFSVTESLSPSINSDPSEYDNCSKTENNIPENSFDSLTSNNESLSVETECDETVCFPLNDEILPSDKPNFLENCEKDTIALNNEPITNQIDNDSFEHLNTEFDVLTPLPIQITKEPASPIKKDPEEDSDENDDGALNFHDSRKLKVFEETRPLISRSTSLKTGKTPPGTPSRKKIVRFADVLGLDLEDIRHIISGDLPNVPPSAYNDLVLAEEEKPEPTSSTIELRERQQGIWENIQSVTGPNALYPTFPIPGQQPNFFERVQAQGICLDSLNVSDFNVQCTCRVMNWGFNKKVLVRYSINKWISSTDIDASHVSGSTTQNTDAFTFNIFLPPLCKNVEFALRYEVNGKEYWDNNCGKNYALCCHSNIGTMESSIPSSPTWVHQFW